MKNTITPERLHFLLNELHIEIQHMSAQIDVLYRRSAAAIDASRPRCVHRWGKEVRMVRNPRQKITWWGGNAKIPELMPTLQVINNQRCELCAQWRRQ